MWVGEASVDYPLYTVGLWSMGLCLEGCGTRGLTVVVDSPVIVADEWNLCFMRIYIGSNGREGSSLCLYFII